MLFYRPTRLESLFFCWQTSHHLSSQPRERISTDSIASLDFLSSLYSIANLLVCPILPQLLKLVHLLGDKFTDHLKLFIFAFQFYIACAKRDVQAGSNHLKPMLFGTLLLDTRIWLYYFLDRHVGLFPDNFDEGGGPCTCLLAALYVYENNIHV